MVKFGTGFNDGLKVALSAANNFLPQLGKTFESAGLVVGDAMAKAVEGDTDRLVKIGAFIGRVMAEGMKATFFKGVDELLPFTGKGYSIESYMRNAVENIKESPELQALRSAESDVRSSRIAKNLGAGFNQNLTGPMMAAFGPQTMSYAAPNPFNQETMSTAVTDGVLRAFSKQPQMAKFAN